MYTTLYYTILCVHVHYCILYSAMLYTMLYCAMYTTSILVWGVWEVSVKEDVYLESFLTLPLCLIVCCGKLLQLVVLLKELFFVVIFLTTVLYTRARAQTHTHTRTHTHSHTHTRTHTYTHTGGSSNIYDLYDWSANSVCGNRPEIQWSEESKCISCSVHVITVILS